MLEHANITVASIDASVAFLSAVYPEWKVRASGDVDTEEEGRERSWLHFGSDYYYIALEENQPAHKASDSIRYWSQTINHIGLIVDDLDAACKRVERVEGVKLGVPGEETPHRRRVYWFDGCGVEWELIEYTTDDVSKRNA